MAAYISFSMGATEILLLRHGQSEGNEQGRFGGHGPTPLTDKGRRQAEAAARTLASEGGLAAIWASDLVRAIETARPIAQATGIEVGTTPALRERSVGVFTGLTFAEAEARDPAAYAALMARESDVSPEGGETPVECGERAAAFVEDAIARSTDRAGGGRLLFVSHAAAINLVLLHLFGLSHRTHGKRLWFRTDNCAMHRLRRSDEGLWQVVALNDRAHLGAID
jgi:broad specificity phosphatase PhoE